MDHRTIKNKIIRIIILPALMVLIFQECYYDSEEDLFPNLGKECNLETVNYSLTISSILENRCYSCHSNGNAAVFGNNISLEGYDKASSLFDNILGAVKHEPGYSPMPKNGGSLSSCEIEQLTIWGQEGTPDN